MRRLRRSERGREGGRRGAGEKDRATGGLVGWLGGWAAVRKRTIWSLSGMAARERLGLHDDGSIHCGRSGSLPPPILSSPFPGCHIELARAAPRQTSSPLANRTFVGRHSSCYVPQIPRLLNNMCINMPKLRWTATDINGPLNLTGRSSTE